MFGMSNLRCWFSIYFSHPPKDPSQRTSLSVRNYMGRFVQNKTSTRICFIPAGDGNTWHELLVSSNSSNTKSWKNTWLKRIYLFSISSLLLFFSRSFSCRVYYNWSDVLVFFLFSSSASCYPWRREERKRHQGDLFPIICLWRRLSDCGTSDNLL